MKYFIAGFYSSQQPKQNQWANTQLVPAIESRNNLLLSEWPGQACDITTNCAINPNTLSIYTTPCTVIMEHQGEGRFREVGRQCGLLTKAQILSLLENSAGTETEGGGGINPITEGEGWNPLGLLNVKLPWWAYAIAAYLIFLKD